MTPATRLFAAVGAIAVAGTGLMFLLIGIAGTYVAPWGAVIPVLTVAAVLFVLAIILIARPSLPVLVVSAMGSLLLTAKVLSDRNTDAGRHSGFLEAENAIVFLTVAAGIACIVATILSLSQDRSDLH